MILILYVRRHSALIFRPITFSKKFHDSFQWCYFVSQGRSWWSKSRNIGAVGASYILGVQKICIKQNKPTFFRLKECYWEMWLDEKFVWKIFLTVKQNQNFWSLILRAIKILRKLMIKTINLIQIIWFLFWDETKSWSRKRRSLK